MTNSTPAKKPWPRYSGRLKTPLKDTDDLTVEIPARLAALRALYQIADDDALWERKLLLTLAHRHVPGFGRRRKRKEQVDDDLFIELVDQVRADHEEATGNRLSADAAITQILADNRSNQWLGTLSHSRAMRIYSGRRQLEQRELRALQQSLANLRKGLAEEEALDKAPVDSAARLFAEMLSRR